MTSFRREIHEKIDIRSADHRDLAAKPRGVAELWSAIERLAVR